MSKNKIKRFTKLKYLLLILPIAITGLVLGLSQKGDDHKFATGYSLREQVVDNIAKGDMPFTQSQEDPHAGWKINVVDRHGYSFEYPSESQWVLSQGENTFPENGRLYTSSVVYNENSREKSGINVFEIVVAKRESSQDFDMDNIKNNMAKNDLYLLADEATVNINGMAGTELVYKSKGTDSGDIKFYFFEKDNIVYNVVLNYLGAKSQAIDVIELGDKILSSLKFDR